MIRLRPVLSSVWVNSKDLGKRGFSPFSGENSPLYEKSGKGFSLYDDVSVFFSLIGI